MIKIIKTEAEYEKALQLADYFFSNPPEKGTSEGDQLELLLLVIKEYEDKNYQVPTTDIVELLKLTMEEKGLKPKDLEPLIGKKSYVSQILNRKKPVTLEIIRNLHTAFNFPVKILLS
jgi:HTH-type transcriptional regulator/antitoxin HigA